MIHFEDYKKEVHSSLMVYYSFYNSMWLVANDIIIGLAIGSFLMNNNVAMAKMLHKILHVSFYI